MSFGKNPLIWSVILVSTFLLCGAVLTAHYKNWVKNSPDEICIMSGFYSVDVPLRELDSIYFVERIPPMQRISGFSALEKEKGIFREFKDSLTQNEVHVLVDNINQQKLKLVYNDSVYLYFNLKDSVGTVRFLDDIVAKVNSFTAPN